MFWRWIIRGLCIALLTLWVAAWVGSYFGYMAVQCDSNTLGWGASLGGGEFTFGEDDQGQDGDLVYFGQYTTGMWTGDRKTYEATPYHLFGFAYRPHTGPHVMRYLMIPLWFPTTLAAGLLWLVWRKTRPKYSGKGFPVEMGRGGMVRKA